VAFNKKKKKIINRCKKPRIKSAKMWNYTGHGKWEKWKIKINAIKCGNNFHSSKLIT
jgi:hypothetical protein